MGMPYLFIPYDEFIETANQYLGDSRFESFNGLEVIEEILTMKLLKF